MHFGKENRAATGSSRAARIAGLHVCTECAQELVYPLDWVEEGPKHWRMLLRCPDCEHLREGLFAQAEVDLFADQLDHGEDVLLCTLKRITRQNMTDSVERFVGALEAGLIFPSDFLR